MKLWKGRFKKEADPRTNDFNSSIAFDSRMYRQDIEGSIAHATMLGRQGIINMDESDKICAELKKIRSDIDSGVLAIDPDAEDIHTFVEQELTSRLGNPDKGTGAGALQEGRTAQRNGNAWVHPYAEGPAGDLRAPSDGLCRNAPAGYLTF